MGGHSTPQLPTHPYSPGQLHWPPEAHLLLHQLLCYLILCRAAGLSHLALGDHPICHVYQLLPRNKSLLELSRGYSPFCYCFLTKIRYRKPLRNKKTSAGKETVSLGFQHSDCSGTICPSSNPTNGSQGC